MNEVYLLTGSNIGNRMDFLSKALLALEDACGIVSRRSAIYETAPWGKADQESFLNQVLQIQTNLDPMALLNAILSIEEKLGRKRNIKYGPRLIDIDILFYNNEVVQEKGLIIPHPQMQFRRFVLQPLAEIAPEKIHPLSHKSVQQMLADCTDPLAVNKFS
jgi:2-amino-4-hydroxy-6-hydroxymethyldihydropteridine diphosphokinase